MVQVNITLEMKVLKGLFTSGGRDKAFARLLETNLNQVLEAQVTEWTGDEKRESGIGKTMTEEFKHFFGIDWT